MKNLIKPVCLQERLSKNLADMEKGKVLINLNTKLIIFLPFSVMSVVCSRVIYVLGCLTKRWLL